MGRALAVVERLALALPPASGAVVMGTGIVSIGLTVDGEQTLSRVLLVVAAVIWTMLGVGLVVLVLRARGPLLRRTRTPAALTGIAATDVLGARVAMLGWNREAIVLLAFAAALWFLLVPHVLTHWRRPTTGVSFVLTVATESVAAVAAELAVAYRQTWLAIVALACLGLGLGFYLFVLSAFDLRQLLVGRGDHWVCGGALAIAALACSSTAHAAGTLGSLRDAAGDLDTAALGLWAAAVFWLPPLLAAELASRRVGYSARRWSTVFPLGMYAACSFAVASTEHVSGIERFAHVWIWVAFAVLLLVFAGMLRRALSVLLVVKRQLAE